MQRFLECDTLKKIIAIFLLLFFLFGTSSLCIADQYKHDSVLTMINLYPTSQRVSNDILSVIQNYTWTVMRYDHILPSENFEDIGIPTPTVGTILIPANMMNSEVCRAALTVYRDSKIQTLKALDEYDSKNMIHTSRAFINGEDEWHTESCYNYRKESAAEMCVLGDVCLKADLVGECYAQASFNTAILRLCGFSANEVFTISIQGLGGGHAVNIVNVDGRWYVFDSTYAHYVRIGMRDSIIFERYYRPPITDYITTLENDKYLINFGNLYQEYIPTLVDPYSNMNPGLLIDIIENIRPLFNNSFLGESKWDINSFIENSTPNPWMKTVAVPFTVADAEGDSIEEKTESLVMMNKDFIIAQNDEKNQNQYDKSLYALGLLSVDYPQAYANAAKLAAWTSKFGMDLDMSTAGFDIFMTSLWIRATVLNKQIIEEDCCAYSDLLYLRHAGSSVDKAILAYGMLRNMRKDNDFWQHSDLYVIITDDYEGFLAVKKTDDWEYLNFGRGKIIHKDPPKNLLMSFNEIEYIIPSE